MLRSRWLRASGTFRFCSRSKSAVADLGLKIRRTRVDPSSADACPARKAVKDQMLAFTLRRAIQAIGVMIAVGIISFSMFRFAGDPVNQIVSIDTSAAERAAIRKSLGLDDPVPLQFAHYFGNAMQFEFGVSYQFRQPVANLLKERMPATLELAVCATILAMVFGILMGVYSSLRRDTLLADAFQVISLIGISLPTFLIGILLIYLFAVVLGWLPSFGRGEVVRLGWWTTGLLTLSGLKALILPSITLGLFQMTLIMRLVRAEMLEVLRTCLLYTSDAADE